MCAVIIARRGPAGRLTRGCSRRIHPFPRHMPRAEGVRCAAPGQAAKRFRHRLRQAVRQIGRSAHGDEHETIGVFRLGAVLASQAEQIGGLLGAQAVEQARLPTQPGRRDADGGQRMAHIVLTIAIGPLPILPRLAPVNRGEADQKRIWRQARSQRLPQCARHIGAHLQAMFFRRVVRHDRRVAQAGHSPADQIALGGMQVAAGWIDAQRPTAAAILLPG